MLITGICMPNHRQAVHTTSTSYSASSHTFVAVVRLRERICEDFGRSSCRLACCEFEASRTLRNQKVRAASLPIVPCPRPFQSSLLRKSLVHAASTFPDPLWVLRRRRALNLSVKPPPPLRKASHDKTGGSGRGRCGCSRGVRASKPGEDRACWEVACVERGQRRVGLDRERAADGVGRSCAGCSPASRSSMASQPSSSRFNGHACLAWRWRCLMSVP